MKDEPASWQTGKEIMPMLAPIETAPYPPKAEEVQSRPDEYPSDGNSGMQMFQKAKLPMLLKNTI